VHCAWVGTLENSVGLLDPVLRFRSLPLYVCITFTPRVPRTPNNYFCNAAFALLFACGCVVLS
jgi:hypothetical protein